MDIHQVPSLWVEKSDLVHPSKQIIGDVLINDVSLYSSYIADLMHDNANTFGSAVIDFLNWNIWC